MQRSTKFAVRIPETNQFIVSHNRNALSALEQLPTARRNGAKITLRSWRRALTEIDLDGQNGYAFVGSPLQPAAPARLAHGTLVIAVDTSWAEAGWYTSYPIARLEVFAQLFKVTDSGLVTLAESCRNSWARDILNFIISNQHICVGVSLTRKHGHR